MKALILLLIPCLSIAGVAEVEKARQDAREARDRLYSSERVQRYCERDPTPEKPFIALYNGIEVEINCKVRNEYVALQRKKDPDWPD